MSKQKVTVNKRKIAVYGDTEIVNKTASSKVKPLVSVLMPVGPVGLKYFEDSVSSIINQTFKDWELIIVLNGTYEDVVFKAWEYAGQMEGSKIKVYKLPEANLVAARNKTVEVSKGKYIALQDSDDISDPTRLKRQYDFLESNPEIGFCGSWINLIDMNNIISNRDFAMGYKKDNVKTFDDLKLCMRTNNVFVNGSVMFRAEHMKNNPYSEDFSYFGEDYELYMRLVFEKGIKGYNIPESLYSYRNSPRGYATSRHHAWGETTRKVIDKFRKYWEEPVISEPIISVNMPVGPNTNLKYFREAVDSIINQTFKDWELIIVLNGEISDELANEVEKYSIDDKRIKIISLSEANAMSARNKAADLSKGKYIALHDSDDISDLTRLETQYESMEANPNIGFCGTSMNIIDKDGKLSQENTNIGYNGKFSNFEELKNRTKTNNVFIHGSIMIKSDVLKSNPYNNDFKSCCGDYELWMRLIWEKGIVGSNINRPLYNWRSYLNSHTDAFTGDKKQQIIDKAIEIINMYKKYWEVDTGIDIINETMNLGDLETKYISEVKLLRNMVSLCKEKGVKYNIDGGDNKLQELPRFWEYSKAIYLAKDKGNKVLDVGTGFSIFPLVLAAIGKKVHTLDMEWEDIRRKQAEQLGLNIINDKGVFQELPYENDFFDVVYSISCLEHLSSLEDLNKSLFELKRVLKPGGYLYITSDYYKQYFDYGEATWGFAAPFTRYFNDDMLYELIIKPSGMKVIGNQNIVDHTDWSSAPLYGYYTFVALFLQKEI